MTGYFAHTSPDKRRDSVVTCYGQKPWCDMFYRLRYTHFDMENRTLQSRIASTKPFTQIMKQTICLFLILVCFDK